MNREGLKIVENYFRFSKEISKIKTAGEIISGGSVELI
jgi:hypothetical protein